MTALSADQLFSNEADSILMPIFTPVHDWADASNHQLQNQPSPEPSRFRARKASAPNFSPAERKSK
jgi:hypothetical protein